MGKIVLDPAMRDKLGDLNEQMELRDENDRLIGVFLPAAACRALLSGADVPFTEEEIERSKKSGGGCSLAEFWQRLGVS